MNAVLDEYWQAYLWTDGLQLTGLAKIGRAHV